MTRTGTVPLSSVAFALLVIGVCPAGMAQGGPRSRAGADRVWASLVVSRVVELAPVRGEVEGDGRRGGFLPPFRHGHLRFRLRELRRGAAA